MATQNLIYGKKVLVNLPAAMIASLDEIAQMECRTRSDAVREALRRYIDAFRKGNGGGSVVAPPTPFTPAP